MKRLITGKVFRAIAALALMSLFMPSAWAFADEVPDGTETGTSTTAPDTTEKPDGSTDPVPTEPEQGTDQSQGTAPASGQTNASTPPVSSNAPASSQNSAAEDAGSSNSQSVEGTRILEIDGNVPYGGYATASPVEGTEMGTIVTESLPQAEGQPMDMQPADLPDEVSLTDGIIDENGIPMGAFDMPINPAPWVAALGLLGTAIYAVVEVGRRASMTYKLEDFEDEVIDEAAAPTFVMLPGTEWLPTE